MNIGILLSGAGSTYRYIADHISPAHKIARVISSSAKAGGLDHASQLGHPTLVINTKDPIHHKTIAEQFDQDGVDLVVMAGYMHLWNLPPSYEGKTINIHPSLIPAFCGKGMYGMHVHRAVIKKGVRFSGCTVHLVDGEYDHGRILEQRALRVESTDTADALAARVQQLEKALLVTVIENWNNYKEEIS